MIGLGSDKNIYMCYCLSSSYSVSSENGSATSISDSIFIFAFLLFAVYCLFLACLLLFYISSGIIFSFMWRRCSPFESLWDEKPQTVSILKFCVNIAQIKWNEKLQTFSKMGNKEQTAASILCCWFSISWGRSRLWKYQSGPSLHNMQCFAYTHLSFSPPAPPVRSKNFKALPCRHEE